MKSIASISSLLVGRRVRAERGASAIEWALIATIALGLCIAAAAIVVQTR